MWKKIKPPWAKWLKRRRPLSDSSNPSPVFFFLLLPQDLHVLGTAALYVYESLDQLFVYRVLLLCHLYPCTVIPSLQIMLRFLSTKENVTHKHGPWDSIKVEKMHAAFASDVKGNPLKRWTQLKFYWTLVKIIKPVNTLPPCEESMDKDNALCVLFWTSFDVCLHFRRNFPVFRKETDEGCQHS